MQNVQKFLSEKKLFWAKPQNRCVYVMGMGGGIILHRKSLTSLKDEENLQPGPLGPAPLAPAAFPVVPP